MSGFAISTSAVAPSPIARGALHGLWFGLLPGLLTLGFIKLLPGPAASASLGGFPARVVESPLGAAVVLFVVFAALGRYWRYHLPGGSALFPLPEHAPVGACPALLRALEPHAEFLRKLLGGGRQRSRRLGTAGRESLVPLIECVRAALRAGEPEAAAAATSAIETILWPTPAARRWRVAKQAGAAGLLIGAAALAALSLRGGVGEIYRVKSASMLPLFLPFDEVVVNKLAYGFQAPGLARGATQLPRRGDVMVFRAPEAPQMAAPTEMVKRAVGLPGDRIGMRNGHAVINGWLVPSCDAGTYVHPGPEGGTFGRLVVEFLGDRVYLTTHAVPAQSFAGEYLVKPGEVFVLGDNRNQSIDSRFWAAGAGAGVPLANIAGRADRVIGRDRSGGIDWKRFGARVTNLALPMPGVDAHELGRGIARCLANPPAHTTPPGPGAKS